MIGLNRIWQIVRNGAQLTVVSLTLPLLNVVPVPQGTILGPLLFLIYINDLPNCLSFSKPRMYADDTHITYAGSDLHLIQSSLSHDLEKLSKWLVSNRLTLNATKTEFMLIGSRQRLSTLSDTLEISIDNIPIEQVSSVKSLVIYIDENLTWHSHIDKLSEKIASAIGVIQRVKPFGPQSTLLNKYNSPVQTHFDYCSLVWGNCAQILSIKLQKLQNRAARVITSSNYDVVSILCFTNSAGKSWLNVKFRTP